MSEYPTSKIITNNFQNSGVSTCSTRFAQSENKEQDIINKYLIEEDISENDGFDSSDESYVEDADSFKIDYKKTRKNHKKSKQEKRTSALRERLRERQRRESTDEADLEGRYMKSNDQVKILENEFDKEPNWSKEKMKALALKLNLKES